MALVFVTAPQTSVVMGRPDDLMKEWQECRAIIGRLDGTLVDLRKYGFGLAAGLMTANGVVGGIANLIPKAAQGAAAFTLPSSVEAALVVVTIALITVLYVVDRYYSILQWGATNRALGLERALSLGVTQVVLNWAAWKNPNGIVRRLWRYIALLQYGSFAIVAAALGATLMGEDAKLTNVVGPGDVMWFVLLVSLTIMWLVWWIAGKEWDALGGAAAPVRDLREATAQLATPTAVPKKGVGNQTLTFAPPITQTGVLAVVKPTDEPGISIVGCQISGRDRLTVTFLNDSDADITPASEDYRVFVYA